MNNLVLKERYKSNGDALLVYPRLIYVQLENLKICGKVRRRPAGRLYSRPDG